MQDKTTAVLVRLPDEIKQRLERVAQKSRRSINKQVIFIIEDWLDLTRNKSEAPPGEAKISRFSSAKMQPIPAALNGNAKGKPAKRLASLPAA